MKANQRVRRSRPRASLAERDDGQLMLLAGIVITLAFIMTSMTLAQVASLERETASQKASPLATEWRFLHQRIATSLEVAVDESATNATIRDDALPRITATFRNLQEEKGYDVVFRLVDPSLGSYNRTELKNLTLNGAGATYSAVSVDGGRTYSHAYDGGDDGIVWETPCPLEGGPVIGCATGIYLYIRLADPYSAIEEYVLFPVNQA